MKIAKVKLPDGFMFACSRNDLLRQPGYQALLKQYYGQRLECGCRSRKHLQLSISYDSTHNLFYTCALKGERAAHDLVNCGAVGNESDTESPDTKSRTRSFSSTAEYAYAYAYISYLKGEIEDFGSFARTLRRTYAQEQPWRANDLPEDFIHVGIFENHLLDKAANPMLLQVVAPHPEGLTGECWKIPIPTECGGRLDIGGVPILGPTLLLGVSDYAGFFRELHAWPVWWSDSISVAVHSGAERLCADLWHRNAVRWIKPPSPTFFSDDDCNLVPEALRSRLSDLKLWPDFLVQFEGRWICVELAGINTPEYRLRLIDKKILYRGIAREVPDFEWLVLVPKGKGFSVEDGTITSPVTRALLARTGLSSGPHPSGAD